MLVPVPTYNNRFVLKVGIKALRPVIVALKGYDAHRANSYYFRRKVPFKPSAIRDGMNYKEISIPMPLSPETLLVEIYNCETGEDNGYVIEKFEVEKMKASEIWAQPAMHRFIDFAQNFAKYSGTYKPGFFDSPDHEFLIQLLPVIKDQFGNTMVTPARTNRQTGRIQVSNQAFKHFTIPVRMFVLLHERQHFQIPTREERPADLAALKLYLDLQYPKIEAVYAATKVFAMHPETVGSQHVTRAQDIINFIDRYRNTQEIMLNHKAKAV